MKKTKQKYLNRRKWQFIGHRVEKRKSRGKRSKVTANEREIPDSTVRRETARYRPTTLERIANQGAPSPTTPEGISVFTPASHVGPAASAPMEDCYASSDWDWLGGLDDDSHRAIHEMLRSLPSPLEFPFSPDGLVETIQDESNTSDPRPTILNNNDLAHSFEGVPNNCSTVSREAVTLLANTENEDIAMTIEGRIPNLRLSAALEIMASSGLENESHLLTDLIKRVPSCSTESERIDILEGLSKLLIPLHKQNLLTLEDNLLIAMLQLTEFWQYESWKYPVLLCRSVVQKCLGNIALAEELAREALDGVEEEDYENEKPKITTSRQLRELLFKQEKWVELESICRNYLPLYERVLGINDDNVYDAHLELAYALDKQEKHEQAELFCRRAEALEDYCRNPDNENEGLVGAFLRDLLCKQGKHKFAKLAWEQKVAIKVRSLGIPEDEVPSAMESLSDEFMPKRYLQ